jgi:hypothetical protein
VRSRVCLAVIVCMSYVSAADARGVSQAAFTMVVARAARIGTVDSVEAVQSNAAAAAIAINPHTSSVPESASTVPVTLFVLHGCFEDMAASEPRGDAAPAGDVLAYIVNQNEEIAAMSLGNKAIPFTGSIQRFNSARDLAIIARSRHRLPKAPQAGLTSCSRKQLQQPSYSLV